MKKTHDFERNKNLLTVRRQEIAEFFNYTYINVRSEHVKYDNLLHTHKKSKDVRALNTNEFLFLRITKTNEISRFFYYR